MAEITMKRIDGAMVTPKDDACLYERAIGKSGIMYGTDISYLGANQVHINAGKGIYKGRDFDIAEQTINVQLSTSGKMAGRIYIHIDLSNTEKPIDILSIAAKALPGLIENDSFNEKLGIGEMELATYTAGEVAITDLRETFAYIGTPYKEIEQQVTGLRENVEQLNSNLGGLKFGTDAEGNYGYIKDGADTVTPFRGKIVIPYLYIWSENLNSPQTHQAVLRIKVTEYKKFSFDHFSVGVASMGAPTLEIKGDSTELIKLNGTACGYKEFDISAYDTITISLLDRMYKSQTAGLYDLIIS